MANVSDEPTKLEMLECVAKVFRDRSLMNDLYCGGCYVLVKRPTHQVTLVDGEPVYKMPQQHRMFIGTSMNNNSQEVYVSYAGVLRVTMTYRQATELAYVLPELKWENI